MRVVRQGARTPEHVIAAIDYKARIAASEKQRRHRARKKET
jgi:hypothetical protein